MKQKNPARLLQTLSSGLALFLLLSSCSSYLADGMRVAWGKQLFRQGNYQGALLHFLTAEQNRRSRQQQAAAPLRRIQYDIGLVYSALGQGAAAIERWQNLLDRGGLATDPKLHFALLYNIGLLYSQAGQNAAARKNLVQALGLQPEHRNARVALELCLRQMEQEQLAQRQQLEELPPTQGGLGDEQILQYISRQANYRFQRDAKPQKILQNDW